MISCALSEGAAIRTHDDARDLARKTFNLKDGKREFPKFEDEASRCVRWIKTQNSKKGLAARFGVVQRLLQVIVFINEARN